MAELGADVRFPVNALLPKAETGASNFLKKFPEYDGREITIAIFDSGVDPRSAGLQSLPNGKAKVIERFDTTGCGDVQMTKKVTMNQDGCITGLSGRNLKVSSQMKLTNADKTEFRVGLKSLFDLYPARVREKLINECRNKVWDEPHRQVVANVMREIESFDLKNVSNLTTLPLEEKLKKENLDASIEILNFYEKKFSEFKTTYDCILYPTSDSNWTAVIDLTETGDLENALVLTEYGKTQDVKSINDYLSVSMNVHNEGNVLEIVGMCSSHGTHVAAIASGYHKESPEINGVAPGAKIVSLTIGDGRLGSMETGTGVIRGIIKVMELCEAGRKIDVINMSYGEHGHWSNSGRIGELMNEVVNKYGVVWVASAGNHGPALCTIGIPPDISKPSCVGVGAYFSAEMMEAEYALRGKFSNVYTWTSRDPCIDGGKGVTICAPGAAITSVPEFTLSKAQLMNGTSMAAPNVAGSVALLLSALKQKKINYSAFSVKRALENSATQLNTVDKFAQGSGLLNVEKAFDYLVSVSQLSVANVRFSISTDTSGSKGIHLRNGVLRKPEEYSVTIEPVFLNDKEIDPKQKIDFNLKLVLLPSAEWVKCGSYLDLCYSSRTVNVRIDPTGLSKGVHQATIKAYDTANVDKGFLFEIPITVVQPVELSAENMCVLHNENHLYNPNTIIRHFIVVPTFATWAILKLKSSDDDTNKFFIHTMQILPYKYCKAMETQKLVTLSHEFELLHPFKCEGNNVLEVCVAKYWSNLGSTTVTSSIEFHGIYATNGNVMHSANGVHRIDLRSLRAEEVNPAISLKNAVQVLKPSETKITPLTERDTLPKGRQIYQNVLTYNLNLAKQQEISINAPFLSSVLYESKFDSQLWMIFDANKMMVGCGDAYSATNFIKLEKGDYVVRLQVRHEKKEFLEKVNEINLLVSFKLSNSLSPEIFRSFNAATSGGKKMAAFQLTAANPKPIYVAPLTQEKLTKAGIPSQCSWLEGTISYAKEELAKKVDVNPFQYMLIEGPGVKKSNGSTGNASGSTSPGAKEKTKMDEYKESLKEFQSNAIAKLDPISAEELYTSLTAEHPKFLAPNMSLIQALEAASEFKTQLPFTFNNSFGEKNVTELAKTAERIIELSDLVIDGTITDTILVYYGIKSDTRSDASKIKSTMDKLKSLLVDAYVKKAISLGKLKLMLDKDKSLSMTWDEKSILDSINKLYTETCKVVDIKDSKVVYLCIWHAFLNNHHGRLAKFLHKLYEDKQQREILEESRFVFKELRWQHVSTILEKIIVNTNPQSYRLF